MGTMMALRAHARGGPEQLVYDGASRTPVIPSGIVPAQRTISEDMRKRPPAGFEPAHTAREATLQDFPDLRRCM